MSALSSTTRGRARSRQEKSGGGRLPNSSTIPKRAGVPFLPTLPFSACIAGTFCEGPSDADEARRRRGVALLLSVAATVRAGAGRHRILLLAGQRAHLHAGREAQYLRLQPQRE